MYKPLISAIMLTKNRFNFFKQSVFNFITQTYEFKELIIINNGNWLYKKRVDEFLKSVNANIKHIKIKHKTIGEMRNVGIQNSEGDYIIVFDDDDFHHNSQMEYQIDICLKSNVDATLLRNFVATYKNERYLCSINHGLEGTMLFRNPRDTIKYSGINQGEDTFFRKSLIENKYNIIVLDNPHELYEYRFHGNNTVSAKHFKSIIDARSTGNLKELQFFIDK
jgi:glycosyltransferase involved in cell wall biosynthesis